MIPGLAGDGGFSAQADGDVSGVGGSGGAAPVSSSAEGWELVVCQELAVEGKFTFKVFNGCA